MNLPIRGNCFPAVHDSSGARVIAAQRELAARDAQDTDPQNKDGG